MPELPEVETIRGDLAETVVGRRIVGAVLYVPEVVKAPDPEGFVQKIRGKAIEEVNRRGKYLLIRLSGEWTWAVHLMLEGQFLYLAQDAPTESNTKLSIRLDNGYELRLRDVVGFAKTWLVSTESLSEILPLDELGPEPLTPEFSLECFRQRLCRHSGILKPLLLDQRVVAGIGNIYADEALFAARIHPKRKVDSLSEKEFKDLYTAIQAVIKEGLQDRGTSARRSLYRDIWGRKGHHQDHLLVFRKAGEPCPGCPGAIQELRVGGRATFICPNCQRLLQEEPQAVEIF